jgi:hypothetical protein
MKCVKCKFKEGKTSICAYPFKATTAGDIKFDKDGNIIGVYTREEKIMRIRSQETLRKYITPKYIQGR